MNVKELIAKFRFSHILCLSIGVLIPIYSDVFFLHGFDSSTVSAIMDTIVAGSVIFAAWSVRNWTKEKINNKGFEHAEKILSNLHHSHVILNSMVDLCQIYSSDYINNFQKTISDKENMELELRKIFEESHRTNMKLSELLADINSLKSWDMICIQEREYVNYIKCAEAIRNSFHNLMSVSNAIKGEQRINQWQKAFRKATVRFGVTSSMYSELDIRFEDVFKSGRKEKSYMDNF
ncbi:hypothetical protein [Kluyvera ascorbata]|uniref:hypothetical protein n=1 Tax=Kluyvera ascorbata TaxID=51288 RepID=UPI0034D6590A